MNIQNHSVLKRFLKVLYLFISIPLLIGFLWSSVACGFYKYREYKNTKPDWNEYPDAPKNLTMGSSEIEKYQSLYTDILSREERGEKVIISDAEMKFLTNENFREFAKSIKTAYEYKSTRFRIGINATRDLNSSFFFLMATIGLLISLNLLVAAISYVALGRFSIPQYLLPWTRI